jgi:hypothetical protein
MLPRSRISIGFVSLVTALTVSNAAIAADVTMPTKASIAPAPVIQTWTYSFTPYIWATSLSGSTTVKGRTTDIDASFIDILNHTEFPKDLFQVAAFGEARYGRFGLLADIAYMKLGLGADITHSRGVDEINGAVGGLD